MNELVQTILRRNAYGTISTTTADGSPWATPVHIVYDDTSIYWLSAVSTVHSQNIQRDSRVFITVFNSSQTVAEPGDRAALYIQTEARKLEGDEELAAREIFADRYPDEDNRKVGADTIGIYAAPIGTLDTQRSDAQRCYLSMHDDGVRA